MKLKIVNKSDNPIPAYAKEGDAGMDIRADLKGGSIELKPGERRLIPTGIYMEIEPGYECQVRPRSGLAVKKGLTVLNAPGTVDSGYRGEVGVPLINLSSETQVIEHGERVAQLVFARFAKAEIEEVVSVEELSDTERGDGGFGHTGVK